MTTKVTEPDTKPAAKNSYADPIVQKSMVRDLEQLAQKLDTGDRGNYAHAMVIGMLHAVKLIAGVHDADCCNCDHRGCSVEKMKDGKICHNKLRLALLEIQQDRQVERYEKLLRDGHGYE